MKFDIPISADHIRDYLSRANISYWGEMSGALGEADDLSDLNIVITEHEGTGPGGDGTWALDVERIRIGIAMLATKVPHYLGEILSNDGDMYTGDILIQYAIFGEEMYC